MNLPIYFHHRAQGAAAEAVDRFQAELQIQVGFTRPDAGCVFHRIKNTGCAANMACGAHTNVNFMAPFGNQTKGFIEGGNMLNAGQCDV